MSEEKPWYQSKTIIGGVVAGLTGALGLIGYAVSDADQSALVEIALSLGALVGGLIAIVGRVTATKRVGGGESPSIDTTNLLIGTLMIGLLAGGGCALLNPRNNGQPLTREQKLRQAETLFQASMATLNQLDQAGKIDAKLKAQITPYVRAAYDALVAYRDAVAAGAKDEDAQYQAFLAAMKRLGGAEAFADPPASAPVP